MELINYQSAEETDQIIELESRRSWLTDVYIYVFFNGYIQEEIRKNFMKRVVINGMTVVGDLNDLNLYLLSSLQIRTQLFYFKMDYINFVEDRNISSDEELTFSDNQNNFIDDSNEECNQPRSFYRFVNQAHVSVEAVNDSNGSQRDRRDLQPEMFFSIDKEHVEFDEFDDVKKCAEKFKKACFLFKMAT